MIFLVVVVGVVLGFFVFNVYLVKVFMGDMGLFVLGGVIVIIVILMKLEILLVIIGGVFVIEILFVIL